MDNDTMGDTLRSQFANPTEANVILVIFLRRGLSLASYSMYFFLSLSLLFCMEEGGVLLLLAMPAD